MLLMQLKYTMKTYKKYITAFITVLILGVGSASATPGKMRVVYDPTTLERTYRIDTRDISQSAPYADYILVMDELPYTPFNVLEALQSRVPGVRVFNQGWNYYATIRGWGMPLYVVDGMPVDAWTINTISPADVATVEVHKGFGANLWGMRGGNGAIVINTK